SSGNLRRAGASSLRSEPERKPRRWRQRQAISELLERLHSRGALVHLVFAQASLRCLAHQRSDLGLGNSIRAQDRDHGAEVTALTRVEHVGACEDALHYLPDRRGVHCHGALPVPLVARLSRVVLVNQSRMKYTAGSPRRSSNGNGTSPYPV